MTCQEEGTTPEARIIHGEFGVSVLHRRSYKIDSGRSSLKALSQLK